MCVTLLSKIPTGCRTIDKILDGGIPAEAITLVYGEAETGKTTLAMQCAMNCALRGYKTLFVDCDGTFSARRLSQIASQNFAEIAELIILVKPDSFEEQKQFMDRLSDYVTKNFGLVIIDTVTSLYRVKIAESEGKAFELNRELNRQMALLAQIAKTSKIAVLATSQVRSVFNDTYVSIEPVATRVLKFWADIILAMKPTENPQTIKTVVEKSLKKLEPSQPLTCLLRIGKGGMTESTH
jgi:DNA repair protein RadB